MAKKKQKSKIKNWLYIELITLFLLLSYLIWFGIPENVFGKKSEVRDEVEGNPGSHLGGVQTSGKPIQQVQDKQLRVPILMYHYIGGNPDPSDVARDNLSVTPEKFDEQMGYLASLGYTPITLDTMVSSLYGQAELPEKARCLGKPSLTTPLVRIMNVCSQLTESVSDGSGRTNLTEKAEELTWTAPLSGSPLMRAR